MCGIAGLARFDGAEIDGADLERLVRAGDRIAHRGPDGQDVDRWGSVGIAFRRLAVYDLEGGGQPFWNEDRTIGLVVNGTIYNHRELRARLEGSHKFATESDCEPMLHLYEELGPEMVNELVGMFAFALWDLKKGRLLLGRDRLGMKPLFYSVNASRILFGSEIKALLELPGCPREIDWSGLLADPALNFGLPDLSEPIRSGYVGIEHLPGGSYLDVDLRSGDVKRVQYWDLAEPNADAVADDLRDEYAALLHDAVDVCLTGEAGIALALSGGVDSAIIAGRSAVTRPVHTLTVLGAGTRANGDAEGAFLIARSLGLPHAQVLCDERTLLGDGDLWKDMLWRCESALCGPEQLLKNELFKQAKASVPGLKVMISGLGGDEFAGGYMTTFAPGAGAVWEDFVSVLARRADLELRRRDPVAPLWDAYAGAPLVVGPTATDRSDPYAAFLSEKRRDLLMYNLWTEDRLASAQSIEARAPYLDHRLVDLLCSIPVSARAQLLSDKEIIRSAGRGLLEDRFLSRRKVPFFHGPAEATVYAPFLDMVAADNYSMVEEAFSQGSARDYVDQDAVIGLVRDLRASGRTPAAPVELLVRLVNLGLLEGMATAGHVPGAETLAPQLQIEDWSDESLVAVAAKATLSPSADLGGTRPRLSSSARLLSGPGKPAEHFLVVDGHVRFQVLHDDPWLDVLRCMDGERTFDELCQEAEADRQIVDEHLNTAVKHGIVEFGDVMTTWERQTAAVSA